MSTEWSKGWPDWRDDGKRVRLLLDDGAEALGTLRVDDSFFDGEDDAPVFSVHTDGGQKLSFAGAKNWLFEESPDLKPGAFYWTWPALDPDANEEWENQPQPARFAGHRGDGVQLWHCIGLEDVSDWPMRWVGDEIKQT